MVKFSFLYHGLDVLILNYDDDILSLSNSFPILIILLLKGLYDKIGLLFNEIKTEFLVFNHKGNNLGS